ncbi:MAG: FAD-dependent oxidoreductase, partial [Planctomycetota bacterium]
RFFNYPLEATNALRNLGLVKATHCVLSYLKQRVKPSETRDTFESWVVNRFGRQLFEIFFKSYSEKLWGIPCDQLNSDFAAQRIKKLSLGEAIKNALGFGGKHQTLVDQFAYPLMGTGQVYDRMAAYVNVLGRVNLSAPVRRVLMDNAKVKGLELMDGKSYAFDHVISTMPLTLLVKGIEGIPGHVKEAASALKFRNTVLVYLNVDGTDLFPDQWIYVHAPELKMGRVTNFRNWLPSLYGNSKTSILALEYWCNDNDPDWQSDDNEWIETAKHEMRSTGLIGETPILDGHVLRIHRSYPVYAQNYREHLQVVTDHMNQYDGLTAIGRYGAFKYNNQDHSILMGLLAADNLLTEHQNNLWSINTDYETYQEAATITAAGLVTAGAT